MTATSSPDLQRLLDEAPFVRSLARALVRGDADDVVQGTWLRVMESDAGRVRLPRRWLASVARSVAQNLRRGRIRRSAHERAAARQGFVPSSAELMEREERRRELVQAVDELPERLRAVVVLRYFEDLPPRAIAERLGLPSSTVANRMRSALATLRGQLDRRYGDRRAWLLPLLSFRTGAVTLATGALAMTTKTKIAGVLGILVLAGVALWGAGVLPVTPPPVPGGPVLPPPLTADMPVDGEQAGTPPAGRREVSETVAATVMATGTLVVEATYAEDGIPVPDLLVLAGRYGADDRVGRRRVRTGADGLARIENLTSGQWQVSNARNPYVSAWTEVRVGADTVHRLELPAGTTVTGVVVDPDDLPVAGAEVWLKFPVDLDAEHAATTGPDGRFVLRACPGAFFVGARAAGHAPSRMEMVLQDSGSKDLRLVLTAAGGGVAGVVLGPDGEPVPDALVRVGEGVGGSPLPAQARTGPDGHFRAVGLAPGEHPVRVRAAHLAPWEGWCQVQDHVVTTVQVTLSSGMSCTGIVVDAGDIPVAGAWIETGDREEFAYYRTYSARDGTFRLDGLPPGDVEIRGQHEGAKAAIALRGAPGETLACRLRLDAGTELRGRVLTASGESVEDAIVNVYVDGAPFPLLHATDSTDAEGRFLVRQCPSGRYLQVTVRGQTIRAARVDAVDPRAGELVIRVEAAPLPSARITGTVVGPGGKPVPHGKVMAYGPDSRVETAETSEAGTFDIGPVVPGEWAVSVDADDLPDFETDWRELAAEGLWDLGIRLPAGGTVRVRLAGAEGMQPRLAIGDPTLRHWAAILGEGDERRSEPVAPGPHYVSVKGAGVATQLVPIEVWPGEETAVDIRIRPGIRQRFRISPPAPPGELSVRILRGAERVLDTSQRASVDRPIPVEWEDWLAPGEYTVNVTSDGLSGRATFTVREDAGQVVRIVLR